MGIIWNTALRNKRYLTSFSSTLEMVGVSSRKRGLPTIFGIVWLEVSQLPINECSFAVNDVWNSTELNVKRDRQWKLKRITYSNNTFIHCLAALHCSICSCVLVNQSQLSFTSWIEIKMPDLANTPINILPSMVTHYALQGYSKRKTYKILRQNKSQKLTLCRSTN